MGAPDLDRLQFRTETTEGDSVMKTTMGRMAAGVAVAGILGTLAVSQATVKAATDTANLAVSATVTAKCTITAPTTLAFGSYDPVVTHAATDLDASTNISVACTKGAPGVWVGLGLGSNASGSTRRMAAGSEFLSYEIYSDASRSSVWGDVLASSVGYTPTSKASTNLTVYGRVASGQDVAAGSYSDSVVATINF